MGYQDFNTTRRWWLSRALTLGALGLTDMHGVLAMSRVPNVEGVHKLQGDVRINDIKAKKGDLVKPGDTVTAGSNSFAVFVVGQDAFLIRENSRVMVSGDGLIVKGMRILTGKLLSVFKPGNKRIHTAIATIGIRGTGVYVEAHDDHTYVCVCYGSADLSSGPTGKLLETIATTHHESPRYIYPGDSGRLIETAPVIDHTDDELIMLESLVGRSPPFVGRQKDEDGGY